MIKVQISSLDALAKGCFQFKSNIKVDLGICGNSNIGTGTGLFVAVFGLQFFCFYARIISFRFPKV